MNRDEYNKLALVEKLEYQKENIIEFPLQYATDFIENQTQFQLNFAGVGGSELYDALHRAISVTGRKAVVEISLIGKRRFSMYPSSHKRLSGFKFGMIRTEFEELEFCIVS